MAALIYSLSLRANYVLFVHFQMTKKNAENNQNVRTLQRKARNTQVNNVHTLNQSHSPLISNRFIFVFENVRYAIVCPQIVFCEFWHFGAKNGISSV